MLRKTAEVIAMSDETVVDKFVGDYEQRDEKKIENTFPEKETYYPRLGVKLRLEKRRLSGVPGGAYAKIVVTGGTWSAKDAVEAAIFRVVDNTLVATNMELESGLLLTETLTMKTNAQGKKEMEHSLVFSDTCHGKWICEP